MVTIDKMLGIGREVIVDLEDGSGPQSFSLSPITLNTIAKLQLYAEQQPLRDVARDIQTLGDTVSEKRKDKLIAEARKRVEEIRRVRSGLEADEEKVLEVQKYVQSVIESMDGTSYILYLCLKDCNEGITEERAAEILSGYGLEAIQTLMDDINGVVKHPVDEYLEQQKKTTLIRIGESVFAALRKFMALLLGKSECSHCSSCDHT